MKDDQFRILQIAEKLNRDYIELINCNKKNNNISLILNSLKTGNFSYALKRLISKIKNNSNLAVNSVDKNITNDSFTPLIINNNSKIKIAVYTCITGNYDNVCEPYVMEDNCDYFIFTNNKNIKSKNWTVKNIPDNILKLNDNVLINRYIKMHPYELFKEEYDYAIYIDGNISIISNISSFCSKVSKKTGLAFHKHYNKNCTYDEIVTCQIVGKGNLHKLKLQEKNYRKAGFPEKYGLFECNIIVSKMKNVTGNKIMDAWWKEFNNSHSKRDQICLPYVLWKNNFKYEDIGIIEENVHLNSKVRINKHL